MFDIILILLFCTRRTIAINNISSHSSVMSLLIFSCSLLVLSSVAQSSRSPVTCFSNSTACDNTEDNVLDTVSGVGTVKECRQLCHDHQECGYITFYGPASFPYRELCFLFRTCEAELSRVILTICAIHPITSRGSEW